MGLTPAGRAVEPPLRACLAVGTLRHTGLARLAGMQVRMPSGGLAGVVMSQC